MKAIKAVYYRAIKALLTAYFEKILPPILRGSPLYQGFTSLGKVRSIFHVARRKVKVSNRVSSEMERQEEGKPRDT